MSVQEEIVNAIISEGVRLALSDAERLAIGRHPTDDAVAYDLYLQARHLAFRGTEADVRKAIDLLVRATGRDPRFAQAYKLLAESYVSLGLDGFARPTEAFPEANRNISRAFEIEPQLAEAHATAAAVAFLFDWDWAAAEREWAIAESLPSGALPTQERVSHSMGRWVLGGPAEALRIVRTLRALDPLTVSYAVLEADYLFRSGQLEAAAALYQKTIDDEPRQTRCSAWPRSGISKGASTRRSTCGAAPTISPATTGCWMRSRTRVVKRDIARSTGRRSNRSSTSSAPAPARHRLRLAARLCPGACAARQPGGGVQLLRRGIRRSRAGAGLSQGGPLWDRIRDDPRFAAAVRRVGLP